MNNQKSIYDIEVKTIEGALINLSEFKGKVMLVVNTASQCGFTYQYEELENLYQKFKDKNFVVLGFPCNQFSGQEPGNEDEIKNFCSLKYNISFPMFSKIEVNGKNSHPLYNYLKKEKSGFLGSGFIKWNFTKFLISPDGMVLERFPPQYKPSALEEIIKKIVI